MFDLPNISRKCFLLLRERDFNCTLVPNNSFFVRLLPERVDCALSPNALFNASALIELRFQFGKEFPVTLISMVD